MQKLKTFFSTLILTIFFSGLNAQASLNCRDIFVPLNFKPTERPIGSSFLQSNFLEPLKIDRLVQKVDMSNNYDPATLDPSLDKTVFSKDDFSDLKKLGLDWISMEKADRLVETDYGFAVMNVHELRDWSLLASIIKNPEAAKEFIENVANHKEVYPLGIARESADWLRWTVYANELSLRNAVTKMVSKKGPSDPLTLENAMDMVYEFDLARRAEYRALVRKKEIFMFPFTRNLEPGTGEINRWDAQVVLSTLARYFLLTRLYVGNDQDGYRLLSEHLDKDSIMLFSRFPELLPAKSVFEDGHFSINKVYTNIGSDDTYTVAERTFSSAVQYSNIRYDVNYFAYVSGKDYNEPNLDILGYFRIVIREDVQNSELGSGKMSTVDYEKLFAQEKINMQSLISLRAAEFRRLTKYPLPEPKIREDKESEYDYREFHVDFGSQAIAPHIMTAFLVFTALN